MAAEIVRHRQTPASPYHGQFLEAIAVPAGKDLLMLSGRTPPVIDPNAPPDSIQAYGDTKTQSRNILSEIETILAKYGYGLGDIAKMQVFLVGDPRLGGKADYQGFAEAYAEFFNTAAQPDIPVRTRVEVVSLAAPGWLVEVDVIAAK